MCEHHSASKPAPLRYGSCLEHGEAHAEDHAAWSRRDFLTTMGLTTAGSALIMGHTPLRAFGHNSLLEYLRRAETDRILVIVQPPVSGSGRSSTRYHRWVAHGEPDVLGRRKSNRGGSPTPSVEARNCGVFEFRTSDEASSGRACVRARMDRGARGSGKSAAVTVLRRGGGKARMARRTRNLRNRMRELRTSGSVGALGRQLPRATRPA